MERRRATWGAGASETPADSSVPPPVHRWQEAVHTPGIYDLEVDTSILSPEQSAELIRQRLKDGPPAAALQRLATMATA